MAGDEDDQTRVEFDTYVCAGYGAVLAAVYSEDEAAAACASDFGKVQGGLAVAKVKTLNLIAITRECESIAVELMLRRRLHGVVFTAIMSDY